MVGEVSQSCRPTVAGLVAASTRATTAARQKRFECAKRGNLFCSNVKGLGAAGVEAGAGAGGEGGGTGSSRGEPLLGPPPPKPPPSPPPPLLRGPLERNNRPWCAREEAGARWMNG